MRSSRPIDPPSSGAENTPRPRGTGSEPLADHALDLAAVRPALRLAHDRADDRADRPVVAGADLLHRVRLVGHCPLDDRRQLVLAGAGEPPLFDDRPWVPALGG